MPKNYLIGLDIGGTKIRGVLWNGAKCLADFELATPEDNLEHFLIMVKAVVDPLLGRAVTEQGKISGLGAGLAGTFDSADRKMLRSPNLPILDGVNLAERLENFLGLPVALGNDADCFTRAEALFGAGRGYHDVYGLVIGTGIGGGWWHGGQIYRGAHGWTNEPGALIVDADSGLNLEGNFHALLRREPDKLSREALLGNARAQDAFADFGRLLGAALANIANVIDPEIFVLGGGVMAADDLFLAQVKKEMKARIESPEAAKKIKVVKAKLGRDAGAIGAALL